MIGVLQPPVISYLWCDLVDPRASQVQTMQGSGHLTHHCVQMVIEGVRLYHCGEGEKTIAGCGYECVSVTSVACGLNQCLLL